MTISNMDLIRKMYALPRNTADDRAELMGMLADDIRYVGVGKESAKGRDGIERLFSKYEHSGQTDVTFEIRHIAENGKAVLVDMLDTFTVDGKKTEVVFSNVFHVENGKITYWQEHYDVAKLESAFGRNIPVTEEKANH